MKLISAKELMEMEFPILLSEKIVIQDEEYMYVEYENYLAIQNMEGKEISFLSFAYPRCPQHIEDYIKGYMEKMPANFHKLNQFHQYKLCDLVTNSEYRRKGLATFLLNKMIEKYGNYNMFGYAALHNLKYLKKFYRRFGFVGTRDDEQLVVRYKQKNKTEEVTI